MTIDMAQYGLTERFRTLAGNEDNRVGRVLSQGRGSFRVVTGSGEYIASVSGKFRLEALSPIDFPAVGDFVLLDLPLEAGSHGQIQGILPRTGVLLRKAGGTARREQVVAANIDILFICMSLNNDFNLRRLERYLTLGWDSGARTVVVLTKADLCADAAAWLARIAPVAVGTDVVVTSALTGDGYAQIKAYIKEGRTIAFIGSSGVGKSSLINRLLGEDRLATRGLRNDDRGRHATTRRDMFLLPGGGLVIDTPGMREIGLWDVTEGLDRSFADIEQLAQRCRFNDCAHQDEPGCAVRAAVQSGALPGERLASFRKLKSETSYGLDSQSYLQAKEKKFKDIAVFAKALKKTKDIRR